jgi:RNA polymerase sigma-70 factor (ECF subfamily)
MSDSLAAATRPLPARFFRFRPAAGSGMMLAMDLPSAPALARPSADLAALLARVGGGDRDALRDLYARTSAKLYGICLSLLRSEAEAEEVLQEAYLTVWRRAISFDAAKASPITWLAVLTRNKALDRLRRRRLPADPIEAANDVADDRPSALDVVEAAEDRARLTHCMDELEPRLRDLIRAAFVEGASYPELAEREAVPLGTMKSWMRRSLLRLRGCLER